MRCQSCRCSTAYGTLAANCGRQVRLPVLQHSRLLLHCKGGDCQSLSLLPLFYPFDSACKKNPFSSRPGQSTQNCKRPVMLSSWIASSRLNCAPQSSAGVTSAHITEIVLQQVTSIAGSCGDGVCGKFSTLNFSGACLGLQIESRLRHALIRRPRPRDGPVGCGADASGEPAAQQDQRQLLPR